MRRTRRLKNEINVVPYIDVMLVLLVIYMPFLRDVFDTTALRWIDWAEILPLVLIPSIAAEIMKSITYKQNQARLAEIHK